MTENIEGPAHGPPEVSFQPWSTWLDGAYQRFLQNTAPDMSISDPGEYVQVNSTPPGTPSSPAPAPGSTYGPPMPNHAVGHNLLANGSFENSVGGWQRIVPTGGTTNIVRYDNPALAHDGSWYLAFNTLQGVQQVAGWQSLPATVQTFKSAATLQAALSDNTVYPDAGAVLYDPEHWSGTPTQEQQYPGWYSSCAAKAVAADNAGNGTGLKLIAAPAISLRNTIVGGVNDGKAPPAEYLEDYIPEIVSTPSTAWNPSGGNSYVTDYVDVQAQQYEATVGTGSLDNITYNYLVQQAAGQINSVNPTATVLAGLTTNNLVTSPNTATSSELETAAQSVKGIAPGFWLNDPSAGGSCPACTGPYPDVAVGGLNLIDTNWASWPNQ